MGHLKYPVSKDELLDKGLAHLIYKMNALGELTTFGSCLHDGRAIYFLVEDEEWFMEKILPQVVRLNEKKYGYNVMKVYDGQYTQMARRLRDQDGNEYYWAIKSNWHSPEEFVKGLESVEWTKV